MARKGGFLKGIVASAATYAVKTAVDIAVNPENMQKVAQLVSEQQVGSKLKQAALSPSARVAKQLDTIEETLEQYADQFPVNAPVERWKSTLQSLRLMDTMNRSTTGSEHKIRLEKLQAQTEALFNEIFQALDSGEAQIEDWPLPHRFHTYSPPLPSARHICRSYTATKWI